MSHPRHPRHSSHTLFTAHASRTHVKVPQTDFPVKPDNSSGSTYDSPSERPLRTKVTFQPKTAPKSIEDTKQRDDHPNQARTDSSPCSVQTGNRDQGPKGSIETQTASTSLLRAMEEASKTSGQIPWLHASALKSIEARLRSVQTPDPLGLGLARLRDTEARKRPYVYRGVYKCRLQGVTSGIGSGFRQNSFWHPLKFISVSTQIHLGFHSNGF